jgi:hypothetical protein
MKTDLPRPLGDGFKVGCAACEEQRCHTEAEWKNHPYRGHGFSKEIGYTHPELQGEAEAKVKRNA